MLRSSVRADGMQIKPPWSSSVSAWQGTDPEHDTG